MTGRLAGKTALITAAGQGIGRATALAMARRRRPGDRDRRQSDTARRLRRRARHHDARARRARRRGDRAAHRRVAGAGHPVQLRRLGAQRHHPRLHAEGLGVQLQHQRPRDVRHDPQRAAEDARRTAAAASSTWRRSRRRSRASPTASSTAPRRPRSSASPRRSRPTSSPEGHPLQRDRARHHRDAVAARAHQRVARPGRRAQDLHRAAADGPPRPAGGDRAAGRLPRVRRVEHSSPAASTRPTAASRSEARPTAAPFTHSQESP